MVSMRRLRCSEGMICRKSGDVLGKVCEGLAMGEEAGRAGTGYGARKDEYRMSSLLSRAGGSPAPSRNLY